MIMPIIASIDMYSCASRSAAIAPITENGSDSMIVTGSSTLSNCAARIM